MVIGFVATGYMTLCIVVVYYLLGFVPREFSNNIDRGIVEYVLRKTGVKPAKIWDQTLRKAILAYSDQQLVTGIALLASGYAQIRCGLSSYHWQIIVYLAWFSTLTHLTTLTFLRQYFRYNAIARVWRIVLMLLLVTMLFIALLPTGDSQFWGEFLEAPILCYFQRLFTGTPENHFQADIYYMGSMLTSVLVLFSGFLTRSIRLSKKASAVTRYWMRTRPGNFLKAAFRSVSSDTDSSSRKLYQGSKCLVLETVYVMALAWLDIWESVLWEVCIHKKGVTISTAVLILYPLSRFSGWSLHSLGAHTTCFTTEHPLRMSQRVDMKRTTGLSGKFSLSFYWHYQYSLSHKATTVIQASLKIQFVTKIFR